MVWGLNWCKIHWLSQQCWRKSSPPKSSLTFPKAPSKRIWNTFFVSYLYCKMTFTFVAQPSWGEHFLGDFRCGTLNPEDFCQISPLATASSSDHMFRPPWNWKSNSAVSMFWVNKTGAKIGDRFLFPTHPVIPPEVWCFCGIFFSRQNICSRGIWMSRSPRQWLTDIIMASQPTPLSSYPPEKSGFNSRPY